MSETTICKNCCGPMIYVENKRKNSYYVTQVDTWVCQKCRRTTEEQRMDKNHVWK